MKLEYQINEKNEIRVWDLESVNYKNIPILHQPDWPNGTPWKDKAEAEGWAKVFVESKENPNSEFLPGNSPEEPKIKRPQEENEDKVS